MQTPDGWHNLHFPFLLLARTVVCQPLLLPLLLLLLLLLRDRFRRHNFLGCVKTTPGSECAPAPRRRAGAAYRGRRGWRVCCSAMASAAATRSIGLVFGLVAPTWRSRLEFGSPGARCPCREAINPLNPNSRPTSNAGRSNPFHGRLMRADECRGSQENRLRIFFICFSTGNPAGPWRVVG